MAKKIKKNKIKNEIIDKKSEQTLPQNILLIGERVTENKNIYISQTVYKEIHSFTKNKVINESGGMLIGNIVEEFGKTNIILNGFIEAKYSEATPTTITFTHDTWEYVHNEKEKKYTDQKIVGWIHTHPNFGIFLSEYDMFIHENFFNDDYQVAYVVDPIQHIEGFYFWVNGKIEKCKGFYVFDEVGKSIEIEEKKSADTEPKNRNSFNIKSTIITLLSICIILLLILNVSTNNKIKELEKKQDSNNVEIIQNIDYLEKTIALLLTQVNENKEEIARLNSEIARLEKILNDMGISSGEENIDPNDSSSSMDKKE